jgi:sensor histidine kinase regulating citrate/malate metabolism
MKEGEDLVCLISDNGVGVNASCVQEKHSSTAHQSVGLKLAQERINNLKQGKDNFKSIEFRDLNPGTEVKVKIPFVERF